MRVALVAVGSELLRVGRRDTNADWLVEQLGLHGSAAVSRVIVGDDTAVIAAAVRSAASNAQLVLLTGGLGPTEDDRTRVALSVATGRPLETDPEVIRRLRDAFEARGLPFGAEQERQATRPQGAEWIDNGLGTAPGIALDLGESLVIAMPGVPAEMREMFERRVRPVLEQAPGTRAQRTLRIAGRTESSVDRQLRHLYGGPGLDVTLLIGREGIEVHAEATASARAGAVARLDRFEREAAALLGDDLYGGDDDALAAVVGSLLATRQETVATAESCTAGLLAGAITAVPGATRWFRGGLVVYADDVKTDLCGVRPETLARHGAVSDEVARELALGVRERCGSDHGLGVTGVAGPGGGTLDKPVGRVHVAVADRHRAHSLRLNLIGDRALIRRRTVVAALDALRRRLLPDPV